MKEGCHTVPRRVTRCVRGVRRSHLGQEPTGALPKPFLGFSNYGGLKGVIKSVWGELD